MIKEILEEIEQVNESDSVININKNEKGSITYTIDVKNPNTSNYKSPNYGKVNKEPFFIILGYSATGTNVFKKQTIYLSEVISDLDIKGNEQAKKTFNKLYKEIR